MDNMEHDVKVLKRLLNSELFLGKYPMVKRVWVDRKAAGRIDIILNVQEPADEYWPLRDEIKSYIYNLAKMVEVRSYLSIYP